MLRVSLLSLVAILLSTVTGAAEAQHSTKLTKLRVSQSQAVDQKLHAYHLRRLQARRQAANQKVRAYHWHLGRQYPLYEAQDGKARLPGQINSHRQQLCPKCY